MTKSKWCVIQKTKTKTKSEFAVKINTVLQGAARTVNIFSWTYIK